MSHLTWDLGDITLHRIAYLDIGVDGQGLFGIDASTTPAWLEPWQVDGQVGLGLAFHVVEAAGRTIVVDPVGAVDAFIRSGPAAVDHQNAAFAALAAAGFDRLAVTHVVLTHLDGIGMAAWASHADDDPADEGVTWTTAFPEARIVVSSVERRHIDALAGIPGREIFELLDTAGAVDEVELPHELAPGVRLRLSGGHSPGHLSVDLDGSRRAATLLGHLAVTPFHVLDASNVGQHIDDAAGANAQRSELTKSAESGRLLGGSLWPAPGYGVVESLDPVIIVPAPA